MLILIATASKINSLGHFLTIICYCDTSVKKKKKVMLKFSRLHSKNTRVHGKDYPRQKIDDSKNEKIAWKFSLGKKRKKKTKKIPEKKNEKSQTLYCLLEWCGGGDSSDSRSSITLFHIFIRHFHAWNSFFMSKEVTKFQFPSNFPTNLLCRCSFSVTWQVAFLFSWRIPFPVSNFKGLQSSRENTFWCWERIWPKIFIVLL